MRGDTPDRAYSTRLRTAVVLTGVGTAGAYHAGVLRALHEAGVRIDLVAGRGIGAIGALFAAVDGGAKLWEQGGIWKSPAIGNAYGWRPSLKAAGWALVATGALLGVPLVLFAAGVVLAIVGVLLWLVGLTGAQAALTAWYARSLDALFAPTALPTVLPRLVVLSLVTALAVCAGMLIMRARHAPARRRVGRGRLWRLLGAPLTSRSLEDRSVAELWNLIRGAAPIAAPSAPELGRKYAELLAENLGQPGFRELLLVAHDMDARRDVVFALLASAHRSRFFGRANDPVRAAETVDIGGLGRDHVVDALAAALALPVGTEAHLVRYAIDGPWRGEAHRLCDRPGALPRLLEEVAAAGAEQVILLSAAPQPLRAHELSSGRGDLRGHAGEQLGSFDTAALRDAAELAAGRFAGFYVIRPSHNPVGPLDFRGTLDERSDRRFLLSELVDRGYEDAYRQFIDPVVGASGERMEAVQS
ncbi:MAG TPA: patatin-like phospholipase family protein [Vicinamibacterales bacterium]|jgi:hypothetical protein|nr:patatin-like phospholipase family protein [Vicinamibacterales bacterium]